MIAELREKFDWIICDSPAGIERGATLAMRYADVAVVVTNPEVSSVRDSDRIIGLLDSKTARAERGELIEKHLLLTRYDAGPRRARRDAEGRGRAGNPVHPPARHRAGERGRADAPPISAVRCRCTTPTQPAARAYIDAARRLQGEDDRDREARLSGAASWPAVRQTAVVRMSFLSFFARKPLRAGRPRAPAGAAGA